MNRLTFLAAKVLRDDKRLSYSSETLESIFCISHQKTFSLVGNARSLSVSNQGSEIDKSDVVIRLNRSPIPSVKSHGSRTDWIATSIPLDSRLLHERSPEMVLWMTSKRKWLPFRLTQWERFFLYPRSRHRALLNEISSRPTTGLMMLDLLRQTNAAQVNIYGFDFFSSLSLSGSRQAADVKHDFNAERFWVENLLLHDKRFQFHLV